MNKADFVAAVAEKTDLSKAAAAGAVDAVIEVITKALKKGDTVTLVGFGTFSVRKRDARTGRNPRTGNSVSVEAKHVPFFKAGKELRSRLNNGHDPEDRD